MVDIVLFVLISGVDILQFYDRDIEHYLTSLKGGLLSEDDMEKSDEEEENVPESYDGDDLLNMLESNEEDTENSQNHESDLPLIENEAKTTRM
ncbi:unnamed protein product [Parnassius apollo]|uniref:(apollo) hypothetical protein n=1 Tax=Parnassius apollo TaxID=110799 RepID=A0A8S3YG24_PARAO|nr:unnamed protein product [Parnassius apollo]